MVSYKAPSSLLYPFVMYQSGHDDIREEERTSMPSPEMKMPLQKACQKLRSCTISVNKTKQNKIKIFINSYAMIIDLARWRSWTRWPWHPRRSCFVASFIHTHIHHPIVLQFPGLWRDGHGCRVVTNASQLSRRIRPQHPPPRGLQCVCLGFRRGRDEGPPASVNARNNYDIKTAQRVQYPLSCHTCE
jgi:hypothetical protein